MTEKPTEKPTNEPQHDIFLPKTDVVFRMLFGDPRNTEILVSFLKAVLKSPALPDEEYDEIVLTDPHLLRTHPDDKLGIVDLKLKTRGGKIIHVEIQLSDAPDMRERVIFYVNQLLTEQIKSGEDYGSLKQVISIVITDYALLPRITKYHNSIGWCILGESELFTDVQMIHTLELSKLPAKTDDTALWSWMSFLRARNREELEMTAQTSPQVGKAVVRLMELSQEDEARMIFEARLKEQRDIRSRERGAREKGVAEGERAKSFEIARKLLKRNRPIAEIVEDTGLFREEIEKLRASESGLPSALVDGNTQRWCFAHSGTARRAPTVHYVLMVRNMARPAAAKRVFGAQAARSGSSRP